MPVAEEIYFMDSKRKATTLAGSCVLAVGVSPTSTKMTLCNSNGKEKKLVPFYEPLQEELDARLDVIFVSYSKLPPLERLRVIENLLRTGAGRSSLAKTPLLQDASISAPSTPLPLAASMDKSQFFFSTSNEQVLRTNIQTWFSPKRKSRWLKLPKTRSR